MFYVFYKHIFHDFMILLVIIRIFLVCKVRQWYEWMNYKVFLGRKPYWMCDSLECVLT